MTYKPFDKELYDRHDMPAKRAAVHFLQQTGYMWMILSLSEQAEMFKIADFEIWNNKIKEKLKVEVEVKEVWTVSGMWQTLMWKTIDIPFRKKESKADLFMMFNKSLDTFAGIKMKEILKAETYIKDTKYTSEERFFAVPVKKFKFYYRKCMVWRPVWKV